jgi:hypothetical protein
MAAFILFVCTGSKGQIDAILDGDLWWGRRIQIALRVMFGQPPQLVG